MEKRFTLALLLSLLVIIGWQFTMGIINPPPPESEPDSKKEAPDEGKAKTPGEQPKTTPPENATPTGPDAPPKAEEFDEIEILIFNERLADVAQKYLRKGSKVYLEGQLQTRKWTDQSGQDKYSTEVVLQRYRGELTMLDSRGDSTGAGGGDYGSAEGFGGSDEAPAAAAGSADLDDEIPF